MKLLANLLLGLFLLIGAPLLIIWVFSTQEWYVSMIFAIVLMIVAPMAKVKFVD